jgi:hypothetical protein
MMRYPSPRPKTAMPYLEPTLRATPALLVGFVVAEDPVVVADDPALVVEDPVVVAAVRLDVEAVEETFAVTPPRPSPPPLAIGTVVTVEKVLDEVAELLTAELLMAELLAAEVELDEEPDEDSAEAVEDDELDEEPDEDPDEPPSVLILCQDPDISLYTYCSPPVE